ncbi:MAG: rhomboid family intramembrane serine protease [Rhizobiales bacterium]|nr:rhomboid family intramembrane serine protease [Hyphomicrobiales bacterium]
MFVPLHDDTPLKVIRFQFMTLSLVIANVVLFLMTVAFQPDQVLAAIAAGFGLVPSELLGHAPVGGLNPLPEPATLFTYMFLHAGWIHLISNMLFLWVFADNIEDAFGTFGFLLFYLLCGIAGGLTHVLMTSESAAPLIGASGAVSGVLAAYMMLYPKARVLVLFFTYFPWRMSALWVLGIWFAFQIVSLYLAGPDDAVAWWAHIGGFVAGLLLTFLLRSRLLTGAGTG